MSSTVFDGIETTSTYCMYPSTSLLFTAGCDRNGLCRRQHILVSNGLHVEGNHTLETVVSVVFDGVDAARGRYSPRT